MYSSAYVWAKIVSYMEERLSAITVSTCLDDAEVVELNDRNLIIYSSSDFRRDLIRRRYASYIDTKVLPSSPPLTFYDRIMKKPGSTCSIGV